MARCGIPSPQSFGARGTNNTRSLEPVVFRQSLENSTEEKNVLSEKVYDKRNKYLNYMCNFFKNKTMTETMYTEEDKDALFSHILVDEKHKLLYCYVPKGLQDSKSLPSQGLQENKSLPSQGLQENKSLSVPGPSREQELSVPGPSREQELSVPGPSREQELSVPGPSREQELSVPGPSREQELSVPGPSREQEPTVPGHSREQEPTIPGHSREQEPTLPGHSREQEPTILGHSRERVYHPRAFKKARVYHSRAFKKARAYRPRIFKKAGAYRPRGLHASKSLPSQDLQEIKSFPLKGRQESNCFPVEGPSIEQEPTVKSKLKKDARKTLRWCTPTPGTQGFCTDNGWGNGPTFLVWLHFFVETVRPTKEDKIILLLENYEAHKYYPALEYATRNNIDFVSFAPHTTNKMQPLYVSVYGPLKQHFEQGKSCSRYVVALGARDIGSRVGDARHWRVSSHSLVNTQCWWRQGLSNTGIAASLTTDRDRRSLWSFKVACTNWKRIFMLLTGQTNTTDVLAIPASAAHEKSIFTKLSKYSTADINILLKTYTKFLFVRHPFERLLSAFRNKLEQHYLSSKYFQSRFGRFIIKHYRVNASNESLLKGDDVKFSEFVAYLIDQKNKFNEHWKPIYDLCHPCLINYDIIGKYETLYEDSDFVLQKAGIENVVFPRAPKPSSTSFYLKSYFSALSKETIEQLYKIYFLDFKLFDYGTIDSLYNGIA
uniref:Carbohydrate sulfotransferase n=1 Tax=Timema tahoe TaxID=61484 RepID=A0A7R9NV30_9NEOP|nr:unnamed protein product [Timema tahoe]